MSVGFKTCAPGRARTRSTHPPVGPLLLRSSTSCHLDDFEIAVENLKTAVKNIEKDLRAQWIFSDQHQHARNEWSLTTNAEGEINTYVIDRTFIDDNNIRWIIDYKTAIPADNESLSNFLNAQKQQHESQLNNYAKLLEKLDNGDIQLGLYFPLCGGWIEWIYADTREFSSALL